MLIKRLSKFDTKNGYILDGIPQNKNQADLMRLCNIIPDIIVNLQCNSKILQKRINKNNEKLGSMKNVMKLRETNIHDNLPDIIGYYMHCYNNIININAE